MRIHSELLLYLPKNVMLIVFDYLFEDFDSNDDGNNIPSQHRVTHHLNNANLITRDDVACQSIKLIDTLINVCKYWKQITIKNKDFINKYLGKGKWEYENIEYNNDDSTSYNYYYNHSTSYNYNWDWDYSSQYVRVNPMYYHTRDTIDNVEQFERELSNQEKIRQDDEQSPELELTREEFDKEIHFIKDKYVGTEELIVCDVENDLVKTLVDERDKQIEQLFDCNLSEEDLYKRHLQTIRTTSPPSQKMFDKVLSAYIKERNDIYSIEPIKCKPENLFSDLK